MRSNSLFARLFFGFFLFWALATLIWVPGVLRTSSRRSEMSSQIDSQDSCDSPSSLNSNGSSGCCSFTRRPLENAAIVVLAYDRPLALQRSLRGLLSLPGISSYTVVVSEDGSDQTVADVARSFEDVELIQRTVRDPLLGAGQSGHAYLAQHYKHILDLLFVEREFQFVIILEDDLDVAPDFLVFFEHSSLLLTSDPSVFCVSAWNDNGFGDLVKDPRRLFRTDFFPGLGWMTSRDVWLTMAPTFPLDQWDNWLRVPGSSGYRSCIVPEVSRTHHFSTSDTDQGLYDKFLKRMVINEDPVDDFGDLSYLLKARYDAHLVDLANSARVIACSEISSVRRDALGTFLVPYRSEDFRKVASIFDIMAPPRAHYEFSTVLNWHGNTFLLVDVRRCPFVPSSLKISRAPTLKALPADVGESCDAQCARQGLSCEQSQFDFVNDCMVLKEVFPCENGFGQETGEDIPVYVPLTSSDKNRGRCLYALDPMYRCGARHRATRRICPCALTS